MFSLSSHLLFRNSPFFLLPRSIKHPLCSKLLHLLFLFPFLSSSFLLSSSFCSFLPSSPPSSSSPPFSLSFLLSTFLFSFPSSSPSLPSYIRCFYWAVLTVSGIHDLEERNPTTTVEYTVEMLGYLLGIFIIAVFIGEVGT